MPALWQPIDQAAAELVPIDDGGFGQNFQSPPERFFDRGAAEIDQLIEAEEQRSIQDIFVESGEEYFRDVEQRVVRGALAARRCGLPR